MSKTKPKQKPPVAPNAFASRAVSFRLPDELRHVFDLIEAERPTVLRIAYRLTGESKDVEEQRLKALTQRIRDGYAQRAQQQKEKEDDTPPLVIETESFEQNKAEGVR